ncbi:YciI family protein [Bremerella cremea]|uniref:YciI family protein n=1 Tax=Bremerella cremea TaxID=1031537 RepID=A0A368KP57_9BACT|nr:YciI family protein [Bremerella cremea]RCS42062.1 YciI family protein [Bremerella cremea]
MKVMVVIKASPDSEAGKLPSTDLLEAMGKFNQQLVDAGVMLAGEGLKPSSAGARVRFQGDERIVTDGPFAETKELIAGFWLWQVGSLQEAIDWLKKCPSPMEGDSEFEIRPVYEMDDFAENDPTGEIRAHEQQLRDQLAG